MLRMELLFSGGKMVDQYCRDTLAAARTAVSSLSDAAALDGTASQVADKILNRYVVRIPVLGEPHIVSTDRKQMSGQPMDYGGMRFRDYSGQPVYAQEIVLAVPFTGDESVFKLRPTMVGGVADPEAAVVPGELRIIWHANGDHAAVQQYFNDRVASLNTYLNERITPHLSGLNEQLRSMVPGLVEARRAQVAGDRNLLAGLSFPLRKRPDADIPVLVSAKPRPIAVAPASPDSDVPAEPVLDEARFDEAINTLQHFRDVLERSPSTMAKLSEEDLRNIMLVLLNYAFQHEGMVGAEVFNSSGRTDLLIRVDGRNVFIGECKFYDGPKKVHETIDQLLSYQAWRDTKAALILFFRSADITRAIAAAAEAVVSHPNCVKATGQVDGERYDFMFHAQNDDQRLIHMVFLPYAVKESYAAAATAARAKPAP